ncbi:MAG: hypothetical protein HYU66_17460 [Armatimonadetes bacterium]|nr:hypothetical protein [Armatimonadota bacterium]
MIDLTRALVVHPAELSKPEASAVGMLVDEVERRTRIRWRTATERPDGATAVVLERADGPAEGYAIRSGGDTVEVLGNDPRGMLYGVGRLLRLLRRERDRVAVADGLDLSSAPRYPLRGHQLGYRPKTNSYDGWSLPMWEQYLRDLAVFGCNAIELIPPRSDDADDSPHFPLPPLAMMAGMSRLCDDYGMDVWVWYPALDADYTDPGTVAAAQREWEEVFTALPRLNAVFVPGGDPGHTAPRVLMTLLEQQAEALRRHHPGAGMWLSPQGFTAAWLDELLAILRDERPAWLTGIVFGPQVRMGLPELRERVLEAYPIRHYPDITHCRQCQFPVPDWDLAYALTEAREGVNPRPLAMARIHRLLQPHTIGFITYSEGCNDDVNKAVWSALGWDPEADVTEILRDYSRYFIGDRYADIFAQGLLALERNWAGPLLGNASVNVTLAQFQAMERDAAPPEKLNWRFQQALYRACYDAYTRRRLVYETELEERARDLLRDARAVGSLRAMSEAEAVLDQAVTQRVATDLRARIFELAEALFQSIRMQLSVERYQAIDIGRGANLDTVDVPLNNRLWLKARFAAIRELPAEADRLRAIGELLDWTNPGPGGFYDNLGVAGRQPHLVPGPGFDADPDFRESPLTGFGWHPDGPISWWTHAQTLYDRPLQLRYEGLDPTARYRVRVVYAGDSQRAKIRLVANEGLEIHPLIDKPSPIAPLEFDLPPDATQSGTLTLSWTRDPGAGGNGRGCQVAEVWLVRA